MTTCDAQTTSVASAARETWDALVIGAGPAGSMTALRLAQRGPRVLLVDRAAFPRFKVCGCCLNPCSLAALDDVSVGGAVRAQAAPLGSFELFVRGARLRFKLTDNVAISRGALDSLLVEAAIAAGAQFLPGTRAVALQPCTCTAETRAIHVESGDSGARQIRARAIVLACGLDGRLRGLERAARVAPRSRIGVSAIIPDEAGPLAAGAIHMAVARGGYVGLVRLETGELNIASAVDPRYLRACGCPARAIGQILHANRLPTPSRLESACWIGTPQLTRTHRRVVEHRLFRVGDAAGYVEPFTGEGIGWALNGARLLADVLHNAAFSNAAETARTWQNVFDRRLRPRQQICRAAALALRHPALLRPLISMLNAMPRAHELIRSRLDAALTATPHAELSTIALDEQ